jgi:hypothetical protein
LTLQDDDFNPTAHANLVLHLLTNCILMAHDSGFSPPDLTDVAWRELRLVASGILDYAEAIDALKRVLPEINHELARAAQESARVRGNANSYFHVGTGTVH